MNRPRKHHYLPQFYLKGFSANGTHLYQSEKGTGRLIGARVADTAAIRDFYKLDFNDCPDPELVERMLSRLEGELSGTLKRVLEAGSINDSTQSQVCQLVSLLQARVPASKASIETGLTETVRSVGILLEKNGKFPEKPMGAVDQLSFDKIEIEIANWKLMQMMFAQAFDAEVLKLLTGASMLTLRAPAGSIFITSDQPVALFNPEARPEDDSGRGLLDPETQISLPLASSLALVLHWSTRKQIKSRMATLEEVDEINRRTITMASERLFAERFDESVATVLRRYGHCVAGTVLSVDRTQNGSLHMLRSVPVMIQELYEPLGATEQYLPHHCRANIPSAVRAPFRMPAHLVRI